MNVRYNDIGGTIMIEMGVIILFASLPQTQVLNQAKILMFASIFFALERLVTNEDQLIETIVIHLLDVVKMMNSTAVSMNDIIGERVVEHLLRTKPMSPYGTILSGVVLTKEMFMTTYTNKSSKLPYFNLLVAAAAFFTELAFIEPDRHYDVQFTIGVGKLLAVMVASAKLEGVTGVVRPFLLVLNQHSWVGNNMVTNLINARVQNYRLPETENEIWSRYYELHVKTNWSTSVLFLKNIDLFVQSDFFDALASKNFNIPSIELLHQYKGHIIAKASSDTARDSAGKTFLYFRMMYDWEEFEKDPSEEIFTSLFNTHHALYSTPFRPADGFNPNLKNGAQLPELSKALDYALTIDNAQKAMFKGVAKTLSVDKNTADEIYVGVNLKFNSLEELSIDERYIIYKLLFNREFPVGDDYGREYDIVIA